MTTYIYNKSAKGLDRPESCRQLSVRDKVFFALEAKEK